MATTTELQTASFPSLSSITAPGTIRLPPILPHPSLSASPAHSPTLSSPYGHPGSQPYGVHPAQSPILNSAYGQPGSQSYSTRPGHSPVTGSPYAQNQSGHQSYQQQPAQSPTVGSQSPYSHGPGTTAQGTYSQTPQRPQPYAHIQHPSYSTTSSLSSRGYGLSLPPSTSFPPQIPIRPVDSQLPPLVSPGIPSALSSPSGHDTQRGVKRHYEEISIAEGSDRHALQQRMQTGYDPLERPLPRPLPLPVGPGEVGSVSNVSTPTGTTSSFPVLSNSLSAGATNPAYSRRQSISSVTSNTHRLSLHMRQEPRAARAGPDGRDRRSLDPPPVVQLLISDFDPNLPADLAELKKPFFVVHCRLISANSPHKDVSTLSKVSEDGSKETQRLLLGTAVSSPFHCSDDPDPENAPTHPISGERERREEREASPTSRFIPPSVAQQSLPPPSPDTPDPDGTSANPKGKSREARPTSLPATFFIFADLSVRKAGSYRLEFSLMKMDLQTFVPGSTVPIIATITSQVFKVVNAKDFDQVQPSTNLVKGLLERGAGFPLKLKKGTREGQRRRTTRDGEGSEGGEADEGEEDAEGGGEEEEDEG